ncbi:hypothetical protein T10_2539 [Trichinella papuae]|uniref:Uncharacterized protein n=1 Tax=Trichinella papuae TaxID=268474 RepID=A0A0V1M1A8_9BILA|nr:hypothetical protein T10_8357 [Trichinella papuae]KRZ66594.1 hypothetical protein T10_8987 [Trichinella papuae]KRZ73582.1 hypothetical protein T10_2539 [Trichinella papuae]
MTAQQLHFLYWQEKNEFPSKFETHTTANQPDSRIGSAATKQRTLFYKWQIAPNSL